MRQRLWQYRHLHVQCAASLGKSLRLTAPFFAFAGADGQLWCACWLKTPHGRCSTPIGRVLAKRLVIQAVVSVAHNAFNIKRSTVECHSAQPGFYSISLANLRSGTEQADQMRTCRMPQQYHALRVTTPACCMLLDVAQRLGNILGLLQGGGIR